MRRAGWLLLAALALAGAACGGDESTGPTLGREQVAGFYQMTLLTFDPLGSLPEKDILARLPQVTPPELVLSATSGDAQLVVRDAQGFVTEADATYQLLDTGIRLNFRDEGEAAVVLLPRRLDLVLTAPGVLAFQGEVRVPRARLVQLVTEFRDEQLFDPVPGTLRVTFTRR